MKLAEATAGFLESISQNPNTSTPQLQSHAHERTTQLLISYYSADSLLNALNAESLGDFLARWYLEKACTSSLNTPESIERASTPEPRLPGSDLPHSDHLPEPQQLLASVTALLGWVEETTGEKLTERCSQTLAELRETLPQAIEITRLLSSWIQERRGAFTFPEFLTSFEEGGSSQYDIDIPGNIGALEGYFRIIRVEGSLVEAEDLISEERVWPITFPPEVAVLLNRPYVINLELLRRQEGWQIASCGFAYPPGTEI